MKIKFDLDLVFEILITIFAIIMVGNYEEKKKEIEGLNTYIELLEQEIKDTNDILENIYNNPEYLVTATVYHAVESQCDDDYLTTASGRKIKSTNEAYSHRYIAVSRDLRELFPYGCKVEVIGTGKYDGIYTVADTMNKRYTEYIDILINPDMPIGKWENVIIKKL